MHPENYGRVEPQYHVSSTTILEKEIFPQDFVSVLHVEHGIVLGKIVKFFTQVWISRTGGDGIYDVIVFCSPWCINTYYCFTIYIVYSQARYNWSYHHFIPECARILQPLSQSLGR